MEKEREELVIKNMRLVPFVYQKHFNTIKEYKDELLEEGYIALVRAAKYFDAENGVRFSTYATKAIYHQMCVYIRNNQNLFRTISFTDIISNIPITKREKDTVAEEVVMSMNGMYEDIDIDIEKELEEKKMRDCINRLREPLRRDLILCYYKNKTYKEIGQIEGISKTAAANRVKKAVQELRKEYLEYGTRKRF